MKLRFVRSVLELLFPTRCAVCSEVSGGEVLCRECFEKYSAERGTRCRACRRTAQDCRCALPSELPQVICSTFYTHYGADPARVTERMIYILKRKRNAALCGLFARELSAAVMRHILSSGSRAEDHVITYIPRSEAALEKYGFDHARLVAEELSRLTGIPLVCLFKRVGGAEQKTLSPAERRDNAESTLFPADDAAVDADCRVLLFDDIITTGASAVRASRLLYSLGACEVILTVIARSRP